MGMKNDGSEYGFDKHADKRDRARNKREKSKAMRGNRSVFIIQNAIGKRAKKAKGDK